MSLRAYCVVNGKRSKEPLLADEIAIEVAPRRELRLLLGSAEDTLTIRLEWNEAQPQTLVIHPGAANLIRVGIHEALPRPR